VLSLQRRAGNAAVRRVLARYGTGEHWSTGGARRARIGGVTLSEGELITMGDLYESAEELLAADPAELRALVRLVRQAAAHQMMPRVVDDTTDAQWQAATRRRKRPQKTYLQLAADNAGHFAPGGGWARAVRRSHWSQFRRYHREALTRARGAGTVPDEAIAVNGFACHFLTDAFAAGHLFNKREMLERIQAAWNRQDTSGLVFRETAFTEGVARRVLRHPVAGPRLNAYWLQLIEWGPITERRFSEFLWQMAQREWGEFGNVLLKLVHDRLNHAIEDDPGLQIEVANARGDTWSLPGDGTLRASPDTTRIMRAAVEESFRNLELAASAPGVVDEDRMIDAVWAYTPAPTARGAQHMETLVRRSLDYTAPHSMDAFAALLVANIDEVIAQLVDRGVLLEASEARRRLEANTERLRDNVFRAPPVLPF
jgi:hypothetical protein